MKKPPYGYPDCRDLRHAWVRENDEVLIETQGQVKLFTRSLVCIRCESVRVDTYRVATRGGHALHKIGSKYRYAPHYTVRGGFDVEELRWTLLAAKERNMQVVS